MQAKIELKNCPETFRNKARYILDTFLAALRVDACEDSNSTDAILISYGPTEPRQRGVIVDVSEAACRYFQTQEEYNSNRVKYFELDGVRFPVLFPNPATDALIEVKSPGVVRIRQDIIASAFFFLSCWQEAIIKEMDAHGRFPYARSLQAKLGIIKQPVVNDYLNVFKSAIERDVSAV